MSVMTSSLNQRSGRVLGFVLLLASTAAWAQGPPPNGPRNPRPNRPGNRQPNRQGNPQPNPIGGTWWRTPLADRVGVTPEQRKKLDDLWQQHRLRRIDLDAALQKAQVTMEPLMQADTPDEGKILSQIDRVTLAQAEVRKDDVRLQLGMRQILNGDQWRKLQEAMRPGPGDAQGNPPPPRDAQQGPNGPPPGSQGRPPQAPPRPPQQPQR